MVRMGTVWDRTAEVIAGRAGMLTAIAALTLWLPLVIQQAIGLAVVGYPPAPVTPGAGATIGLLGIVIAVIGLWGKLALVAVASDPATTRSEAFRLALGRLPALIGITLLVGLAVLILSLPIVAVAAAHGANMVTTTPVSMRASMSSLPAGQRALLGLYGFVLMVALTWLIVRLIVMYQVVLNEREGVGSFRRSMQITRHHFWRLFGVLLLFLIVFAVATWATRAVTGVVFSLVLGVEHLALAAFLSALFTTAVSAAASLALAVFATQFYLLRREASAAG